MSTLKHEIESCLECLTIPFKIVQKNFYEIKIIIIEGFLGKATGHNDHYTINMGSQRPKIGGNWPLTGPYLQHCIPTQKSVK